MKYKGEDRYDKELFIGKTNTKDFLKNLNGKAILSH